MPTLTGRNKVAVIGFTTHQHLAPWQDPTWDLKGLNDLHSNFEFYAPGIFTTDRVEWYQLHRDQHGEFHGARDPNHFKWMSEQTVPIWMWHKHPQIPGSRVFPIQEILTAPLCHGKPLSPEGYYNNSISWMIAHAILQGYQTIGVWGVDMAIEGVHGQSEYGYQRPSVEYLVGVARGLGIDVLLPDESEICKCGFLYGWDNMTPVRRKLTARIEHLVAQENDVVNNYEAVKRAMHECLGARQERLALLTEEQRATDQRCKDLEAQHQEFVNQYEALKRQLHEVRGAKNNTEWLLRNYFPGDGAFQDVSRTERSVIQPPQSDGQMDTPFVNRIAPLVGAEG